MNVVVMIPTYNERENIGPLMEDLQEEFRKTNYRMTLLVVDDDSPDGTSAVVRRAMGRHENVHLLSGRRQGLGEACARGYRHALGHLDADVVAQMDADFSHRPRDMRRMISALEKGADFVIASRYTKGGHLLGLPLWKRAVSRAGNAVARHVARLRMVADCTSGFRAMRSSTLKQIDPATLHVRGFAIHMVLLHRAIAAGAKVRELPVTYEYRARGSTKMRLTDVLEFIMKSVSIGLGNRRSL